METSRESNGEHAMRSFDFDRVQSNNDQVTRVVTILGIFTGIDVLYVARRNQLLFIRGHRYILVGQTGEKKMLQPRAKARGKSRHLVNHHDRPCKYICMHTRLQLLSNILSLCTKSLWSKLR